MIRIKFNVKIVQEKPFLQIEDVEEIKNLKARQICEGQIPEPFQAISILFIGWTVKWENKPFKGENKGAFNVRMQSNVLTVTNITLIFVFKWVTSHIPTSTWRTWTTFHQSVVMNIVGQTRKSPWGQAKGKSNSTIMQIDRLTLS